MTTARENILKVFRHEMPDYIPMTVSCDPFNKPSLNGMPEELKSKLGKVNWGDESPVTLARWLGLEIFSRVRVPIKIIRKNSKVEHQANDLENTTCYHSKSGKATQIQQQYSKEDPPYCLKHSIETLDDIKVMTDFFADEQFEICQDQLAAIYRRKELVGEDGIVALSFPGTPLGQLIRVYAGVANVAILSFDYPSEFGNLLDAMKENFLRQLAVLRTVNVDAIWSVDDTSTTCISPMMFKNYAMDYIDLAADEMHRQNKLYIHHSCGLIKDLVPLYRQTRMDAVHALCIPPIGDVTIAEAKQALGQNIAMMPCMIQTLLKDFQLDDAKNNAAEMFKQAAPGDNFFPTIPSDQARSIAEMEAFIEGCNKYRFWPRP